MNDDRPTNHVFAGALLFGVVLSVVLARACTGTAQDIDQALLLDMLRVRISEADFRPECDTHGRMRQPYEPPGCVTDGAAIIERHAEAARRRHTDLRTELRAYSRRATGQVAPRSPRGAWVAALTLDFTAQPPGWPATVPWANRTQALRQIEGELRWLLRAALDGEPWHVCNERPDHWGGDMDGVPRCWRRIDCGPTENHFYVVECPRIRTVPASVARGRR